MNRPGSCRVRLSGVLVALLTVLPVFGVFSGSRAGVTYQVHGLNFSPYLDGQDPNVGSQVPEAQLRARMTIIAPYTEWIRTFCCNSGLEAAGRVAHALGLRIALGAWLGRNPAANEMWCWRTIIPTGKGCP
jgi:exo-beta-1,3-glucanase (GH17 family)